MDKPTIEKLKDLAAQLDRWGTLMYGVNGLGFVESVRRLNDELTAMEQSGDANDRAIAVNRRHDLEEFAHSLGFDSVAELVSALSQVRNLS